MTSQSSGPELPPQTWREFASFVRHARPGVQIRVVMSVLAIVLAVTAGILAGVVGLGF